LSSTINIIWTSSGIIKETAIGVSNSNATLSTGITTTNLYYNGPTSQFISTPTNNGVDQSLGITGAGIIIIPNNNQAFYLNAKIVTTGNTQPNILSMSNTSWTWTRIG
jgi:hypothetical protein